MKLRHNNKAKTVLAYTYNVRSTSAASLVGQKNVVV